MRFLNNMQLLTRAIATGKYTTNIWIEEKKVQNICILTFDIQGVDGVWCGVGDKDFLSYADVHQHVAHPGHPCGVHPSEWRGRCGSSLIGFPFLLLAECESL